MTDLEVKRWTRYGHDRLYVQTPTGERLGYWDCRTGTAVVQPGADRAAFDAALAAHLPTDGPVVEVPAPTAPSDPAPPPAPLPEGPAAPDNASPAGGAGPEDDEPGGAVEAPGEPS